MKFFPLLLLCSLTVSCSPGPRPVYSAEPKPRPQYFLPGTLVEIKLEKHSYEYGEKVPILKITLTNHDPRKTYAFMPYAHYLDIRLPDGRTTVDPPEKGSVDYAICQPKDVILLGPQNSHAFELQCWALEKEYDARPLSVSIDWPNDEPFSEMPAFRKVLEKSGITIADNITGILEER
jgi:hypothetical protein